MADSTSSGDPDIDAAFGGPSASTPASAEITTRDPDVDAAIKGMGTASSAPSATSTEAQDVRDLIARNVTRGAASVVGGLRATGDVLNYMDPNAPHLSLADIDNRYRQFVEQHTQQPRSHTGQNLAALNDSASRFNPLNIPGQAINDVGDVLGRDLFGSREAGAWIGGAGQAAAAAYGLKSVLPEGSAVPKTMEDLRSAVGPDVTSGNAVEHGDALVQAYQDKDAVARSDISAKYKALQDANGGKFPVDAIQLEDNVANTLHSKYLYEHAPPAEMKQLSQASAQGSMSFEQYEAMRTNLADIMRSSNDPLQVKAAGIMRDQMEQLPLTGGAANLKPLADTARAAARTRAQAIAADPAYKAAVNAQPNDKTPDTFVQKYVMNGSRDAVAQMRQNLSDNPTALQTIGVSALDKLNDLKNPTNAYRNLQPKMDSLLAPEHQAALDKIVQAKTTAPGPIRKFVAKSAPAAGALVGGHLAGPVGAGVGDLAGQTIERRILGQ
jgi:hypothetical protein